MNFIETIKNFYSYLFLGRCRRHGRDLTEVQVNGHYASTMPVCIECHPLYRDQQITPKPLKTAAAPASPELAEVEVG